MKKTLSAALLPILMLSVVSAQDTPVIPAPDKVIYHEGLYTIRKDASVVAPVNLTAVAELFAEDINRLKHFRLKVIPKGKTEGNIQLVTDKAITHTEGYQLIILPGSVTVRAASDEGFFYGLQSLKQLILFGSGSIKAQTISDHPRFQWRGVMLDVSRTFMPLNLVKRYVDLFSLYKLNVVHLHLTDDQGWRIEIKKYPLLTEIGSKFDPQFNRMGGYYSQTEIRDLVSYAQARNVMLVPEIEMPGHAVAAIASYPDLSCEGKRPVIHTFFEGKSIHEEIFCAGKESTYQFIYGVLDELCELFPSPYIHIGGDEAPKAMWEKCPHCQKMMKDNNLDNEEELQSLFVRKIGDYLRSKNRILVGWDEIIDGGMLAGNEVLMFWRGWKLNEVEKEVREGFRVVCTPTTHCYFDYPHSQISTRIIYEYDPVISGTDEKNYLGVQANFWSHIDRSENNIDKQLFPRVLGLAETAWCSTQNKNWDKFKSKALKNVSLLKERNIFVYGDSTLTQ